MLPAPSRESRQRRKPRATDPTLGPAPDRCRLAQPGPVWDRRPTSVPRRVSHEAERQHGGRRLLGLSFPNVTGLRRIRTYQFGNVVERRNHASVPHRTMADRGEFHDQPRRQDRSGRGRRRNQPAWPHRTRRMCSIRSLRGDTGAGSRCHPRDAEASRSRPGSQITRVLHASWRGAQRTGLRALGSRG